MRFIIATDSADEANTSYRRDNLTGFLQGKGWHVWHWFQDLWLVNSGNDAEDFSDETVFERLRSDVQTALGSADYLLFLLPEKDGLLGRLGENKGAWLTAHWGVSKASEASHNGN